MTSCRPKKHISRCKPPEDDYEKCQQWYLDGTLAGIVATFIHCDKPYHDRERAHYTADDTLEKRIRKAARSIGHEGKMCGHQRRIGMLKLETAIEQCLIPAAMRLDEAAQTGFDRLHMTVQEILSKFAGVGTLFYYDFSERFGHYYMAHPQMVHLHCGALEGANVLVKKNLMEQFQGDKLPVSAFPAPLNTLDARDIESVLCIYCSRL
ncbi:hypothetical protein [Nitratidesulfovibrio sp.]|uniref:hypothetical protein n=1 Tax=Nitratidesulfovibrio sp. TaxID=2802297 RepID=UPI003341AF23